MLPEVPTLHEQGLADFEDVTWNGIVAPAATPRRCFGPARGRARKPFRIPNEEEYEERGIEMVASASPEEFTGIFAPRPTAS